uniref:Pentatricopeptide repeat-containing protein n=1 Tax=Quercus lobata TaxID=97700 RepID=A0A7N2MFJ5_QUELO
MYASTIVDAYAKNLDSEKAYELFHEIEDIGVGASAFTFASFLSGAASINVAGKAMEMFHKMLEDGVRPNEITYTAVLSACSHVGLVSEGWKLFNSMYREHGIVPRVEHYACMVDLLGRSGSLLEAFEFINSMPFKADALVWRTFLAACRVHGNKELGEHAAKMILEQDPYDPAAYFVLHDVEDELKEQYLFQHSEKIAVAFGLISVSQPKPIRVFKNLRVCGDCHTAIKFISMARAACFRYRSYKWKALERKTASCK